MVYSSKYHARVLYYIKPMKYLIILTALLISIPLSASASEEAMADSIRNEQNRKSINEIKLEESAFYAEVREAIQLGKEDEDMAKVKALSKAQQKSINLLQTHVVEIFAKRMKMSKQEVQIIWDVINDKCQHIEVKRGDLFRVFSYIMKDALRIGLKGKIDEEKLKKILGEDKTLADSSSLPAIPTYLLTLHATEGGKVNGAGEYRADTTITLEAIPAEGFNFAGWLSEGDTLSQEATFNYTMPAKESTLTACFVKEPEVKEDAQTDKPESPQPSVVENQVEVPTLCHTMLGKDNMTDLLTFLDSEKAFHKLIYGNQKNMKSPEKCYIVIVEKGSRKVKTVLGPGQAERMNYVTKQPDNYNNYRGSGEYMAVFVQELK